MSGLIGVSTNGDIELVCDSFSHMFLGYTHNDLVGKVRCSINYNLLVSHVCNIILVSYFVSQQQKFFLIISVWLHV